MSHPPAPEGARLDDTAVAALQDALATEHAALWCYSLALAFLPAEQLPQARSAAVAHRELRTTLEQVITASDVRAVPSLPAYATPAPVVDGPSAAGLLVVAEADGIAAWRSVLERTTDQTLREFTLKTMSGGTVRCAGWRTVVGTTPAIPIFPGRP